MTLSRLRRIWSHRIRALFQKDAVDREVSRELAFHLEQLTNEYTAAGVPPEEARRAARRDLGNVAVLEEQCRDQRGVRWLDDLKQDFVYGLRMLYRAPGFTAVAALSLAIGIGANAAILRTVESALLEQLPYVDASRLVIIRTVATSNPGRNFNASLADYLAWKQRSRAFEAVEASLADERDFGVDAGGAPPERIAGQMFTPGLFPMLGVTPVLGRVFTGEDPVGNRPGAVIVISHRLWQQRYGGDPHILSRPIRLNGVAASVIGVMPPDFRYPNHLADYWAPMRLDDRQPQGSARFYVVIARLAPGRTFDHAQAELGGIAARLALEFPEHHDGWGVRVQPLHSALFGWTRTPLFTLQVATVLVLLIACANVAGLLLARGAVRAPEITMRVALGAGRGRIVRQLLTESVLLSGVGGVLGVLVAWWGLGALTAMGPPPGASGIAAISLDVRLLGILLLVCLMTGLAFGVVPALLICRGMPLASNHSGRPPKRHRVRGALVAAQIGLALMLLIASGLLINSFIRLAVRDLHFRPDGLLTFEFRLPGPGFRPPVGMYQGFQTFEVKPALISRVTQVYERLRLLPGAESVAGISYPPVNSLVVPTMTVLVEGRTPPVGEAARAALSVRYFLATPNLFATMGTPLVRGRDIDDRDTATAAWVAIVNETMARLFWPGEDAIGKRFRLDVVPEEQMREIVGVVRDIPQAASQISPDPVVYASYLQQPSQYRAPWANMHGHMMFLIRTAGDPLTLAPTARLAAAEIEPDRPIFNVQSLGPELARDLRSRHSYVFVLGVFALAATALAAVGIYGVMAFTVAQRTKEIGIRIALGAGAREIAALVGRRAVVVIASGLLLGLAGSLAVTRLISSQLWGVRPTDPVTFAGLFVLLAAVALMACGVPVRRALRVDPTITLRYE